MAGGHLDYLFTLPGPIPAGEWHLAITGYDGISSPHVLAADFDLLSSADAGTFDTEQTEVTPEDAGAKIGLLLNVEKSLPAVAAACGDTLRIRFSATAPVDDGGFLDEVFPTLSLP